MLLIMNCLICFSPIRGQSYKHPDLLCPCIAPTHKRCWLKWSEQTGTNRCLICREPNPFVHWHPRQQPVPMPPPPPHIVLLVQQQENRIFTQCLLLVLLFFMLTWIRAHLLSSVPINLKDEL